MPSRGKKKEGKPSQNAGLERVALEQALELSHALLDEYEQALRGGDDVCGSALIHERTGRSREKRFTKVQERTGSCPVSRLQCLARAQKKIRTAACQVRVKRDALQSAGTAPPELLLRCRQLNLRTQELGALKRLRLSTLVARSECGREDDELTQATLSDEDQEEQGAPHARGPTNATVAVARSGRSEVREAPEPPQTSPDLLASSASAALTAPVALDGSTPAGDFAKAAPVALADTGPRADEQSVPPREPRASDGKRGNHVHALPQRPALPSKWMMYGPPLAPAGAVPPGAVKGTETRREEPPAAVFTTVPPLPPGGAAPPGAAVFATTTPRRIRSPPAWRPPAPPREEARSPECRMRSGGGDGLPHGVREKEDVRPQSLQARYVERGGDGCGPRSAWSLESALCAPPWSHGPGQPPPYGLPLPPGLHYGWSTRCDELAATTCTGAAYELLEHFWGDGAGSLRLVESGERLLLVGLAAHVSSHALVCRARTGARGTVPWDLLRALPPEDDAGARSWGEGTLVTLVRDWYRPPWELFAAGPAVLRAGTRLMLLEDVGSAQTAALVRPFPHEGSPLFVRVANLRPFERTDTGAENY